MSLQYQNLSRAELREAAHDYFLARAGITVKHPHPRAEEFATTRPGMKEIAEALGFSQAATDLRIQQALRSGPDALANRAAFAAGVSSDDFKNPLGAALRQVVERRYDVLADYLGIVNQTTVRDFRPVEIGGGAGIDVDVSTPVSELQPANQVVANTRLGQSIQVFTYAARLGVSRQVVVNDDIELLSDAVSQITSALVRRERKAVFEPLTNSGYLMADGQPLFAAANGNLLNTTNGNLTLQTFGDAVRALRKQKLPGSNEEGNLKTTSLIVGLADEMFARSVLWQLNLSDEVQLIVENALAEDMWFVQAAPEIAPTLTLARLEGTQRTVGADLSKAPPRSDDLFGVTIRADFGVNCVSRFGIVKSS